EGCRVRPYDVTGRCGSLLHGRHSLRRTGRVRAVIFLLSGSCPPRDLHSFPTRRSSDLTTALTSPPISIRPPGDPLSQTGFTSARSEEHTSELQSRGHLVCRLLLEKKKAAPPTRPPCRRTRPRATPCAPSGSRRASATSS